jgi:hypothetical protein
MQQTRGDGGLSCFTASNLAGPLILQGIDQGGSFLCRAIDWYLFFVEKWEERKAKRKESA